MNDDKIRISPDALIAMIVTEAENRELAQMPSLEEMNADFQPSINGIGLINKFLKFVGKVGTRASCSCIHTVPRQVFPFN